MRTWTTYLFLTLTVLSCSDGQFADTTKEKTKTYQLIANSTFKLLTDPTTLDQYKIQDGDKLVFIYQKEGVTFVDAYDYEPEYTEVLIFEIDPSADNFEYKDKEIGQINCQYAWQALTKIPKKEIKKIEKGTIKAHRVDNDTWEISVDINTDFKFGGFLDKQGTRKIEFERIIKTADNKNSHDFH